MSDNLEYTAIKPSLSELTSPRGIAVVGASQTGTEGYPNQSIICLKKAGYPYIYPVNPKYTEVWGIPCYPSIKAIPGIVDHVIVSIPAEAALPLLDDCIAKGVKSVHIFAAGFSESGETNRIELEKAILKKAREGGFRIIGPNSTGMQNPKSRLVNRYVMPPEPGPVGFLSQSGGYADDLPLLGGPRGLRFSTSISYGNAVDLGESEIMDFFAHDPDTEIIAAYIEGVRDGKRFSRILKEAAARKPVVVQKGGVTEAGKRAASSHTASLTSSVAVFNAVCRQMHAIQVDDLDELVDTLVALRFAKPLPQGRGVAVAGTGGGPSVLASDEIEKAGLHMPLFSRETQTKLKTFLPPSGGIFTNPIDSNTLTNPESIYATFSLLGALPEIHTLIYHMGFHPISQWGTGRLASPTPAYLQAITDAFKQVQKATGKPIMMALRPSLDIAGMKDFLAVQEAFVKAQFPVFHSLKRIAGAIARLVAWKSRG